MSVLLTVQNLTVHIPTPAGVVRAVDGIDLSVSAGEIVGLVGESGSGKSLTALSLLRLHPVVAHVNGRVWFDGQEFSDLRPDEIARRRGSAISMIFQDPLSYLNPVMRTGVQIAEVMVIHEKMSWSMARALTIELLNRVGIPSPQRVYDSYPHELSGGMRQRALIALAIIARPKLLIADEPTTALDVTVQAQIMDLLRSLCADLGTALILITHDLGLVAEYCDRAYVMYAGRIVESAPVDRLFHHPLHPYTRGLLRSILPVDRKVDRFDAIEGSVPQLINTPPGCLFWPRCANAVERCATDLPEMMHIAEAHGVACWLHGREVR